VAAVVLAAVAFGSHVLWLRAHPLERLWGDERTYLRYAELACQQRIAHALPGGMLFEVWPPFAFGVYGLLASCDVAPERSKAAFREFRSQRTHDPTSGMRQHPEFEDAFHFPLDPAQAGVTLRRLAVANSALLAALGVLVYALCRRSGCPVPLALAGMLGLYANPRLGFYATALWPELLHAVLLWAGVLALAEAARRGCETQVRAATLSGAGAGVLLGLAALTKGIALTYALLAGGALAALAFRQRRERALLHALAWCLAAYLLAFQATLLPQRAANQLRHGTTALATNFWLNVEAGVTWGDRPLNEVRRPYYRYSDDSIERESLARRRVLDYLAQVDPGDLARRMRLKLVHQLEQSYLTKARRRPRWQAIEPEGEPLYRAERWAWRLNRTLLAFAPFALLFARRWTFATGLVALFAVYYAAGLLLVIGNSRMLVQLLPAATVLSTVAAYGIGSLAVGALRRARSALTKPSS
jgi:hypothetical protein